MAVTVEDVATTLKRPIMDPLEVAAVRMWLADAALQIRLRFPGRVDELDPEAVDYVIREAVAAKVKAPDVASRVSVAVDDASVTRDYTKSTGLVTIWDDWWDLLAGTLPDATASDAFSIRLAGATPRPDWECW